MSPTAPLRRWSGPLVTATLLAPQAVCAQDEEPLRLELEESGGGIRVELGNILATGGIRQSLESGLPVRIQVLTELWRDQFFDAQEGREEWLATVWYDPLSETYRVETGGIPIGLADSPGEATEILRAAVRSGLRPERPGTYYYLGRIEIETLSLSDLEELRRWLQGELAPVVGGDEAVGGALGRGIRRLFVRALGLPAVRFQTRTPEFDWEG